MKCSFCGNEMERGTGKISSDRDGNLLIFCSSKCEKNSLLGRKPQQVQWTRRYKKEKEIRMAGGEVVEKAEARVKVRAVAKAAAAQAKKRPPKKERKAARKAKKLAEKMEKKKRKGTKDAAKSSAGAEKKEGQAAGAQAPQGQAGGAEVVEAK